MSKALVITLNDGTAIKWAGKYHNHLAKVSPENGRIEQMLPVRIRRMMKGHDDYFVITREGTEDVLCEPFKHHRDALEWIASIGLFYVTSEAGQKSYGIVRKDYAEDLLLASLPLDGSALQQIAA